MKLFKNIVYLTFLAFLGMFIACHRTEDSLSSIQTVPDKTHLNTIFKDLRSTPQSFSVVAGKSQFLQGLLGTHIQFYENSFLDAQGNVITSGNIDITLIEMYKPGDMLANRSVTTDNGNLLMSGGQVCIKATMNGQEVFANKYGLGFRQTDASSQPMALFYGNRNNDDSMTNWAGSNSGYTGAYAANTNPDSSYIYVIGQGGLDTQKVLLVANYYQFDSCIHFNWINCDHFYNFTTPLTDVKVVMPDTSFNVTNTEVYIVFPSLNALSSFYVYTPIIRTFELSSTSYVPTGLPAEIVVIGKKAGQFYYFEQKGLTIASGMQVVASMTPTDAATITAKLKSL